jgi:uncharacterized membrane protein required for colicin V production
MNNLLAIPTYIETGMLKIATIDILVFAVLAIALIVGYVKGFMKQILSILGFFASTVLAVLFSDDLANFVFNNMQSTTSSVRGVIESMVGSVLGDNLTSEQALLSALAQSKIPAFLHETIANLVVNSNFDVQIVDVLTKWALTVICFLIILIVANIVFIILKKFFKFITQIPLIKVVDKTLGMLFSAIKALAILLVIFIVLSLFTNINQFLVPGDGVTSIFNSLIELIMDLPFLKNILTKFNPAI